MNLDDAFYPALAAYARSVGAPAEWFLRIFYLESALRHDADNGSFVGLNQIDKNELRRRGVDPADYRTWQASRQLREVVGPWYASTLRNYLGKPPRSIGVLYALNLAPGYVKARGDAPETLLYASPDVRYTQNQGLDANGDGRIVIADLDAFLAKKAREAPYQAPRARLASVTGGDAAGGAGVPWGLLTVAALAVGGIVWTKGR